MKGLFQALQKANRTKFVTSHLGIAFKLGIKLKVAELAQEQNEVIHIKKNGKDCVRHIDHERQKEAQSILTRISNKNRCDDIFKNTVVDKEKNLRMYPSKTQEQYLDLKIRKTKILLIYQKIALVLGLKCVKGLLLVRLTL